MASEEGRAANAASQEWRVPEKAVRTACRFCGAPVTFTATAGGPKCLDLRTVRKAAKGQEMAMQHRCTSKGGGRG